MKIVLATHNKGKIREFREALAEIGWEAEPISEVADLPDPDETGATFEENALQKARYYSAAIHAPVLSDDSGIVADALNGRPGIYSARYAGNTATMRPIIRSSSGSSLHTAAKSGKAAMCARWRSSGRTDGK